MERRMLLVFALTFLVLLAAQPLLMKYLKPAQAPTQQAPEPAATQPSAPAPVPVAPPIKAPKDGRQASSESETVIDNDVYRVTLSNRGGMAKSWILKDYKDDKGNALELIHKLGAEKAGLPLSLWTYDESLRNKLNSALYVVSSKDEPGPSGSSSRVITFEYADAGTVVRKIFSFNVHSGQGSKPPADHYVVGVEVQVVQNGSVVQAYPAWPAGFGDQTSAPSYAAQHVLYMKPDGKVERLAPDRKGEKLAGGGTVRGPFYWAGAEDQYFAAVFLPNEPESASLITLRNAIQIPKNPAKPNPAEMETHEVLGAAVGNSSGVTRQRIFVGPKAVDVIESIKASPLKGQTAGPDLGALVDFGRWLGFIAKPLFLWLKWTYEHWVPNWGWAIIVLTVIINLALLPLRLTQMKSALKMQKVQPQVNAIKKRFEKIPMRDPRRAEMNQEIAALFKREKVNPAGGCFPLLIQFPFLIAFYSMLSVAIELRQAPWLWVKDLSSPDPYYILPVLIVVSTYLMQKMTPSAGMDPAQQRMMMIMMPIMLGFFSWSVAAGLGVYWVASTVIAIVQQWVMNRTSFGREMREEAEKRARKKELKAKG
jgi:YidC/Oxa1 family membrane protein insertase